MKRDFLELVELTRAELEGILELSAELKHDLKNGKRPPLLAGKTLAMIFEKPSLRTRVTFEVGMTQLGGYAVYLSPGDIQLGQRESVADIARNLELWVDFIMARTFAHETLVQLARPSHIPVINGLSDLRHPCQVLSDCFTVYERRGRLDDAHVAYLGDGNNMANSWVGAAIRFGFSLAIACPPGYDPDPVILARAKAEGARVLVTHEPKEALSHADVVYTDVWASMGQEDLLAERRRHFQPFQVNAAAMHVAKPDALVMHCLPAHRGEEITADVIDGPQSIVLPQAENRLHVQKGVLVWLNQHCTAHK